MKKHALTFNKEQLPTAVICDIDGTIALMGDRSPFDWKRVGEDAVNNVVVQVLKAATAGFKEAGSHKTIMLSGRDSACRRETEEWLQHNNIEYDHLYMRKKDDYRKDTVIKKELYESFIQDKYSVAFVLDDRDCVVDMWRNELGLTVFQVADGNF